MVRARAIRPAFARLLAGALFAVAGLPASALGASNGFLPAGRPDGPLSWAESPYRHFGPPRSLASGRAVLFDEADDPTLRAALSARLRRLLAHLYQGGGWRNPFAEGEVLRIYVARSESGGVRRLTASGAPPGRLRNPAIELDATGLTTAEIAREVARRIVLATLSGYGAPDDAFLAPAAAEVLARADETGADGELWQLAAAPELDLRSRPASLGRVWVEEALRETRGTALLREVWEEAAETGEGPTTVLARQLEEAALSEDAVLLRAAARLYAALEPEPSPARLRLADLESGALDAAPPEPWTIRHRVLLPDGAQESLRVAWPEDAGEGAVVVRYLDPELPPDAVFLHPREARLVPLSGVARLDFVVVGSAMRTAMVRAPASVERVVGRPYSGLAAQASAGPDQPRLTWTTTSHAGLRGWAVFREQVLSDGRVLRSGPEVVPSSVDSIETFRYVFVDESSDRGTFYRYTVWAVTDEGLLARAFAVTLRTQE
jgi:hypothetical protein